MTQEKSEETRIPINMTSARNSGDASNKGEASGPPEHNADAKERTAAGENAPETGVDPLGEAAHEINQLKDRIKNADQILHLIEKARAGEPDQAAELTSALLLLVDAEKRAWDSRDSYVRNAAELENYKRRAAQEKSKLLKYKNEELLRDLLPVVDNLGRALRHADQSATVDSIAEGVKMIQGMLTDLLTKYGVEEIPAKGEIFDPNRHEALSMVPAPGVEPNTITEELEKGYTYQDRLLRAAKVVIAAPSPESGDDA